jgi:hypothetical protein
MTTEKATPRPWTIQKIGLSNAWRVRHGDLNIADFWTRTDAEKAVQAMPEYDALREVEAAARGVRTPWNNGMSFDCHGDPEAAVEALIAALAKLDAVRGKVDA